MERGGLHSPEERKHVKKSRLFDVDGVLSDPREKQVTEPELYNQIIKSLQVGEPVGLNTGRSTKWMVERFVNPLLERIEDKTILENFVAIGEKGGTWVTFDNEGNMHHGRAKELAIPSEVIAEAKGLVETNYSDSMFFDDTKETMLSIEMHDRFDLDTFHQNQRTLVEDLAQLLERKGLADKYNIDPTTIATDVESPSVGKALGTDRFLQFLRDKNITSAEFETFGDSKSDFAMADELERRGKSVKMVYVGDKEKLGEFSKEYAVAYVGNFSQGTLHYLQNN
jgi:hydroxymethylpyrimidine pyrophosphatase-like HAD family hydrolase